MRPLVPTRLPLYASAAREAGRALARGLSLPRKAQRQASLRSFLRLHFMAHRLWGEAIGYEA